MDRDNFRFDSGILALPEKSSAAGKIIEMAVYLLLMLLFLSMAVSMCGYAPLSVTLAAAALVLILCFTGRREWDARAALPAILLLAAAVRIAYIFIVPTQPVSDFHCSMRRQRTPPQAISALHMRLRAIFRGGSIRYRLSCMRRRCTGSHLQWRP